MANFEARRICSQFAWRLCRFLSPICIYNPAGNKVSNWWLFLCLAYISCIVVGVIFTVAGFTSLGFDMAAVGVVLVIVGACLAILCDFLRRFGCGWSKNVATSVDTGQTAQENSDIAVSIPFLPGYPGFCTATGERGASSDIPPSYEISTGREEISAMSTMNSAAPMMTETSFATCTGAEASCEISSRSEHLQIPDPSTALCDKPATNSDTHTRNPAPPPYDIDNECPVSLSQDFPPPYEETV